MKKDGKWFFTIFLPKLPFFLIFLPVVIIIRCLRPIIWIRFIPISERIGHAAGNIDVYILEKKLECNKSRAVDIFFPNHLTKVNQQLLKLWSRVLPVSRLAYWISWVNMEIPGGKAHFIDVRPQLDRDINSLVYETPPPVSFIPFEEERGEALLRSMGIPKGARYICIHGRDSAFLNHQFPDASWGYHSYRDYSIGNFVLAAEELVRRGYYVIRIGRIVREKFPFVHPKVVDYANSPWVSDFADIYLISKCYFYVGQSGIETVARLFRKDIVITNFIPLGRLHTWSSHFVHIFKILWDKKEKRFLSFKEMLKEDIRHAMETKEFEDRGLEVIENSPDEIRDTILEMEERLNGKTYTKEQDELQARFWRDYPLEAGLHGAVNKSRIGASFLEKHRDLL